MFRAIRNLALSQTARDTYWVFGGNVVSTGFNVLFFIAVVRSLVPADFGLFSSLSDFVVLVASIADLGVGSSLARFLPRLKEKAQRQFLKTSFRLVALIGFLILAFLLLLAPVVGQFLFTAGRFAPLVRLAAAGIFAYLILGVTSSALFAKREFKKGVSTEVLVVAAKALLAVWLLFLGRLSLATALLIFALAPLFGTLMGINFLNPAFLFVREARGTLSKLFTFTRFMAVTKISGTITGRVGTLMLLNLAGAYETGIYSAAFRFASIYPLLAGSFGVVLAPRFAGFNKTEEVVGYLKKVILLTVGIIATIPILALLAEPLVILIAGSGYAESVSILRWLILSMVPFVATIPAVSVIVYWLKKPQVLATASLVQLGFFVLLNFLLIPKMAILGLVVSLTLSNILLLAITASAAAYGLKKA